MNYVGHGGVNDAIVKDVEVGVGVYHGVDRSGLVLLHDVSLDLLHHGVSLDFVVDISDSVLDINLELIEEGSILGHDVAVESLHTMTKDDGVRDLDHGGLVVVAVLYEELLEGDSVHPGGVNDLASLELKLLL